MCYYPHGGLATGPVEFLIFEWFYLASFHFASPTYTTKEH